MRYGFCVFFTISFLLYEKSEFKQPSSSIKSFLKKRYGRILFPIVFWFTVSAILKILKGNSVEEIILQILRGEIFTGAYYLLALLQLLPIFFVIRNKISPQTTLLFGLLFHGVIVQIVHSLLKNPLTSDLINLLRLIDRPVFIYWIVYLCMGIYISNNLIQLQLLSQSTPRWLKTLLIISICLLFWCDYTWLEKITDRAIAPFDYLTLASVLSVPTIFYCFSSIQEDCLPQWLVKIVKILAKYSLGIFCINGILRLIFLSLTSSQIPEMSLQLYQILLIKFFSWFMLLIISLVLSIFMNRLGFRKMVT